MSNVTVKVDFVDAPLPQGKRSGDLQYVLTTRPDGAVINRFVTPEVKEDEIIELSDELLHEVAGGAGNAAIDF